MSVLSDKILSRIDIVTIGNDKDLFIQAAAEIICLEQKNADLREEIGEFQQINDDLKYDNRKLAQDLSAAEDEARSLNYFSTDDLLDELMSRNCEFLLGRQNMLDFIADLKLTIQNNDTVHREILFDRLLQWR